MNCGDYFAPFALSGHSPLTRLLAAAGPGWACGWGTRRGNGAGDVPSGGATITSWPGTIWPGTIWPGTMYGPWLVGETMYGPASVSPGPSHGPGTIVPS